MIRHASIFYFEGSAGRNIGGRNAKPPAFFADATIGTWKQLPCTSGPPESGPQPDCVMMMIVCAGDTRRSLELATGRHQDQTLIFLGLLENASVKILKKFQERN